MNKRVFALIFRGAAAVAAAVRLIVILRFLPTDQYAVVAVIEGAAALIGTLVSGGVTDAMLREGVVRSNGTDFRKLVFDSLKSLVVLSAVGMLALLAYLLVFNSAQYRHLLPLMFAAYSAAIIGDKLTAGLIAIIRTRMSLSDFYLVNILSLAAKLALVIGGVFLAKLPGYLWGTFISEILVLAALAVFVWVSPEFKAAMRPNEGETSSAAGASLRNLSIGLYGIKMSVELWRRVPLLLLGAAGSPAGYGFLAGALQLSSRIHIVNKALNPLIIPATAKAFTEGPQPFAASARTEMGWGVAFNLGVIGIAALAWFALGEAFFGHAKWIGISRYIYLALAAEAIVSLVSLLNSIVLIHSRTLIVHAAISFVLQAVGSAMGAGILILLMGHQATWPIMAAMLAAQVAMVVYTGLRSWLFIARLVAGKTEGVASPVGDISDL